MISNKFLKVFLRSQKSATKNLVNFFNSSSAATANAINSPEKSETVVQNDQPGGKSISKAMFAYMERAREHEEFMAEQESEFVFGRRHLANIMGRDPETFTQKDIDESIRYLFPSGLFQPTARPMMKPPREIHPKQKAAQFDLSGRPHHPFFYTSQPNFFYLLHEVVSKLKNLNLVNSEGLITSPIENLSFSGTIWIDKAELENRLLEKVTDPQYEEWINTMNVLSTHKYSEKELEFIKSYRKPLASKNVEIILPVVTLEEDGRKSVTVNCRKKTSNAEIKLISPGTGEFKINDKGLDYFDWIQSKEMILYPLQLSGWLNTVDVVAKVVNGGQNSQAVCVRYGISMGLAALGAEKEKLRLAGLLTIDWRNKERSKIGHDGARDAWTWKAR